MLKRSDSEIINRSDVLFGTDVTEKITKLVKKKNRKEDRTYWKDIKFKKNGYKL